MAISSAASLTERMSLATKKQHTELNQLLTQRLPFALPPHASTPLLYTRGLVPFARLLLLFEAEWELLNIALENGSVSSSDPKYGLWHVLANLRPCGLPRTHRLRNDIKHLTLVTGSKACNTVELGEEWNIAIRTLIRQKPHTLVAFAWFFYMAVLSGGRWIQQQLANAGPEFWTLKPTQPWLCERDKPFIPENSGYSFLSFDDNKNSEDLKVQFKDRLLDVEEVLTDDEKQDVVDVAQSLFDRSIDLIKEVDRTVQRQAMLSRIRWILNGTIVLLILVLVVAPVNRILSRLF